MKTNFGGSSWQLSLGSSVLADRCFFCTGFTSTARSMVILIDHSWFVQKWAIPQGFLANHHFPMKNCNEVWVWAIFPPHLLKPPILSKNGKSRWLVPRRRHPTRKEKLLSTGSLDCASAFERRLEHIGREIHSSKFTWQTWGLKRDPLNWLSGGLNLPEAWTCSNSSDFKRFKKR